mmetsp:Transcript_26589/g.39327  ORF Transcript_26589/g.39327 Transcript_26589/m.39327 type:complete len:240 (+) Transcript_26589:326-1045(+)
MLSSNFSASTKNRESFISSILSLKFLWLVRSAIVMAIAKLFSKWSLCTRSNARSSLPVSTFAMYSFNVTLSTCAQRPVYSTSRSLTSYPFAAVESSMYFFWFSASFARRASSSRIEFLSEPLARGILRFSAVVTGRRVASGKLFPPLRGTQISFPSWTVIGQKVSSTDLRNPTVSRIGLQFQLKELSFLVLATPKIESMPSESITIRDPSLLNPAQLREERELIQDKEPEAISSMEIPS